MTVGTNPFGRKEGGDPLFEGRVVCFEKIDRDFMRPSGRGATCRHDYPHNLHGTVWLVNSKPTM